MNRLTNVDCDTSADLVGDLWQFIEDVTEDDPERIDKFFALRERVREQRSRALPARLDLPSGEAIETVRFYFRGYYAGCLTAVVYDRGVQLALKGRLGGHKGYATASRRALEREACAENGTPQKNKETKG